MKNTFIWTRYQYVSFYLNKDVQQKSKLKKYLQKFKSLSIIIFQIKKKKYFCNQKNLLENLYRINKKFLISIGREL